MLENQEIEIKIPQDLSSFESLTQFISHIHSLPIYGTYVFDFGKERWFPPSSMLFLAINLKQFIAIRGEANHTIKNFQNHSYQAHMGFFQLCGFDFGKRPGEALGNTNYIPLTKLGFEEVNNLATKLGKSPLKLISEISDKVAKVTAQNENEEIQKIVTYCCDEIIRNSFQHSSGDQVYYCSQFWPKTGLIETCIADMGIGIRQAISENPKFYNINDDQMALRYALLAGASGKLENSDPYDFYANSGFGLYMTNRICSQSIRSSFHIISGSASLFTRGSSGYKMSVLPLPFKGTMVRMGIDIRNFSSLKGYSLDGMLKKFHDDAKATDYFNSSYNTASTASIKAVI